MTTPPAVQSRMYLPTLVDEVLAEPPFDPSRLDHADPATHPSAHPSTSPAAQTLQITRASDEEHQVLLALCLLLMEERRAERDPSTSTEEWLEGRALRREQKTNLLRWAARVSPSIARELQRYQDEDQELARQVRAAEQAERDEIDQAASLAAQREFARQMVEWEEQVEQVTGTPPAPAPAPAPAPEPQPFPAPEGRPAAEPEAPMMDPTPTAPYLPPLPVFPVPPPEPEPELPPAASGPGDPTLQLDPAAIAQAAASMHEAAGDR